jgi:general secretion pathway protein J
VRAGELQETWLRSQQFQGGEPGQLKLAEKATAWQIYFARGGQWSNAQSTGDVAETTTPVAAAVPASSASSAGGTAATPQTPQTPQTLREAVPEAVRMVITLSGQKLTRDIALGPAGS